MTRRKGDNYLGQEKQKQPRPHYALINKTIIWYGFLVLCLAGALVHTYIHTYIHTLHTYRRIAASRAMLRWSSSVSSRTSIPTDSMPRKCKGRIRRSAYCPVCMYVCMYSFEYSQPAGKHANSYNPCMIQYQTLKPL